MFGLLMENIIHVHALFPPLDGTLLRLCCQMTEQFSSFPSAHEHKHEAYLTANSHSNSKPINLNILQRNAEVLMCNTRPQVRPLFITLKMYNLPSDVLKMNPVTAAVSSDFTITLHSRHSVGCRNFKTTISSLYLASLSNHQRAPTLILPFTDSGRISTQILYLSERSNTKKKKVKIPHYK